MRQIEFKVKLPVSIKKDKVGYISTCSILDVVSQGNTKKESLENIREAVGLFLLSCFKRGTLSAVLKECGFTPVRVAGHKRSKPLRSPHHWINVPLPFEINPHQADRPCHA